MPEWKAGYSVGNAEIDAQHRRLLSMVAECERLVRHNNDSDTSERFHDLLNDMSSYARHHFNYEESLLSKHGYAKLREHIKLHDAYWEQLTKIMGEAMTGTANPSEVQNMLTEWWMRHILEDDMQYRDCLAGEN